MSGSRASRPTAGTSSRCTDSRPAKQQTLTEVKPQIEQIIVQKRKAEAYQKFLDELRKNAKIEVLLEDLKAGAGKKASTTATGTK